MTEVNAKLLNRDYTMIIDRSGSMGEPCPPAKTRWMAAAEAATAVARKISEFDPDGITVYTFSNTFKRHENATADKVAEIFRTEEPNGSTALHAVLKDAIDNYFRRRDVGKSQPNGEAFFVITDGTPDDEKAVAQVIKAATLRVRDASELSITLIQVGTDARAKAYLHKLDDDLEAEGAKFDIVDTITMDDMGSQSLTDVITRAVTEHKQAGAA